MQLSDMVLRSQILALWIWEETETIRKEGGERLYDGTQHGWNDVLGGWSGTGEVWHSVDREIMKNIVS